jgi:hypothetical protein
VFAGFAFRVGFWWARRFLDLAVEAVTGITFESI